MDIKKIRADLGMTQAKAAEWLGVPLRTYQKWEIGTNPPTWAQKMITEKMESYRKEKEMDEKVYYRIRTEKYLTQDGNWASMYVDYDCEVGNLNGTLIARDVMKPAVFVADKTPENSDELKNVYFKGEPIRIVGTEYEILAKEEAFRAAGKTELYDIPLIGQQSSTLVFTCEASLKTLMGEYNFFQSLERGEIAAEKYAK